MNRCEFESFVLDNYNACADFPWYIYPNYEVFRHANSKKWFAVVMDVPKFRLGLDGEVFVVKPLTFAGKSYIILVQRKEGGSRYGRQQKSDV